MSPLSKCAPHAHTNYHIIVRWPLSRFLLLTVGMRAYMGSSSIHTDDASCFNASQYQRKCCWISMHTQITISSFADHYQGFCCSQWECELTWGHSLSTLMMLVASMTLSINVNAAEFPWYTLQIVAAVLLIVDLEGDKSSLNACPEDGHHRVFD